MVSRRFPQEAEPSNGERGAIGGGEVLAMVNNVFSSGMEVGPHCNQACLFNLSDISLVRGACCPVLPCRA